MMTHFAIAECEDCGGKWLIATHVWADLLEGCCPDCQPDRDVEKPLTFKLPTKLEMMRMELDEEVSKSVAWRYVGDDHLAAFEARRNRR